jgi:hypothetical protein
MKNFTFARTFSGEKWNINNPNDVDANGKSVSLDSRIQESLPGLTFDFSLDETMCYVNFDVDLTDPQIATLNQTVQNHEQANGVISQETSITLISYSGYSFAIAVADDGTLKINQQ